MAVSKKLLLGHQNAPIWPMLIKMAATRAGGESAAAYKMPSHPNCVVPGCPNRKDHCEGACFPMRKMFRDVRCTSSTTYVDVHWMRMPATPHLLASQSHFIGYQRT